MSRVSKPPKATKGRKTVYRCEGGPFTGHDFALATAYTMVFAVEALGRQWRGRYTDAGKPGQLAWQDVPLQAAA